MTAPLSSSLPASLYRAEQVRAMDAHAITQLGLTGYELMQRAGGTALAALSRRWPSARTLSVVCGGGNNGGDGYVLARLARAKGMDVRVYPLVPVDRLRGDALRAYEDYRDAEGPVLDFVPADFEGAEVLADGLLGTGLDRPVEGLYAEVIKGINRFSGGVLALDIPSGLNADTGHPLGIAVNADITATFVALKQGLFTGGGPAHCGEIVFDDLGIPPAAQRLQTPSARLLPSWVKGLPRRARDAHKGHFGHVLVLGGDLGYGGAVRMAGEAAARVGAGLVSLATRPEHAALLSLHRPELMSHGVAQPNDDLPALMQRARVLALGPGLGRSPWGRAMFGAALASGLPLVADADALNLLAETPLKRDDWILTPHPGEAARLLQTDTAAVQKDRYAAVAELRRRYGGTVVLKGAGTLVLGHSGLPEVCTSGNPGMATGGMGDVLTGVIAGLLAQGLSQEVAAATGVRLHGAAGDAAAEEGGERGMLASDLMRHLRRLINL
ncbi:NAD(P)H-hydrate dehydratase [Methylococcus sp. EFPC2]|uniref:NAD(P)H-hydrate dehydratase n=1 Tax=Methylococcus sp. EFPC2 TaxID=2812648 RepID=UPI00196705FD|nr:NAD(P)H-hydrate dehydratase [Methylococcus sp. EFPC2]QSA98554.1 NAD(P)H-hydrate dehydratase [Methylococcus sp. EFPC2]